MNLSVAYLLLGPAGLLEHHPGDVGSLRVGHGGGGQVALLVARLALTQQSATAAPGRAAALGSSKHKLQRPLSRSQQSLERMRSSPLSACLLCITSTRQDSSLLRLHAGNRCKGLIAARVELRIIETCTCPIYTSYIFFLPFRTKPSLFISFSWTFPKYSQSKKRSLFTWKE